MNHITSNEENLLPLVEAFKNLESGEIIISSGWIRSDKLRYVLGPEVQKRIKDGKVTLRLLLRIGSPTDIKITDSGVFSFIKNLQDSKDSDVKWKYSSHHHAKLYAAGTKWAMMGSFNLTGGGFGTEDNPGNNPEAGLITTTAKEVSAIRSRFNTMWEDAITLDDFINGFVANKSENGKFWMIGVKALPAGQFIQVLSDDPDEIILGKIERSYRYHQDYHQIDENPLLDKDLMYFFTGKNEDQNRLNGIAGSSGKTDYQLNTAEVKLLMSVKEQDNRFIFNPVNIPPAVASAVIKADPALLKRLFNPASSSYAVLEENREVDVSFDDAEILSKHFAVIGATGSGKSYFVKKYIIHRLQKLATKDLRVIIIDTHGEYASELSNIKIKNISADENQDLSAIPLDNLEDFKEYFGTPSTSEKKLLLQAFREAEHAGKGKADKVFIDALKEAEESDKSDIMDWESILDDLIVRCQGEEKKPSSKLAGNVWVYLNEKEDLDCITDLPQRKFLQSKLKENILTDIRKTIKLEESSSTYISNVINSFENGNYRLETLNLVDKVKASGLYCLDLTSIDESSIRQNIVGDLMQEVFNRAKKNQKNGGSFKTLFVVDEAQNYAAEKSSKHVSSNRWMKIIASEGRKFNVALLVMTQRPAYVSKDVLSQCSSQAIFRLINQGDIDQVAGTVEGISEYDLMQLPQFTAGQALFTGVGMQMPVRVRVLE